MTNEILEQLDKNSSSEMELNLLQNKEKANVSDISNILNDNNVNNNVNTNVNIGMSDNKNVESETDTSISFDAGKSNINNININNFSDKNNNTDTKKEKMEMLFKLFFLKKKGYPIDITVTANSSYDDIKFEYEKIKAITEKEEGIKSYRHLLVMSTTFLEYLNGKFNPFDIHLDGWSENVYEDIDNYDSVFEELLEKYKSKTKMAPEVRLIMMIAGSALMYHLMGNTAKELKKGGGSGGSGLGGLVGSILGNFNQQQNNNAKPSPQENSNNLNQEKNVQPMPPMRPEPIVNFKNNTSVDTNKLESILANLDDSLKSDTDSSVYSDSDIYETETSIGKRT